MNDLSSQVPLGILRKPVVLSVNVSPASGKLHENLSPINRKIYLVLLLVTFLEHRLDLTGVYCSVWRVLLVHALEVDSGLRVSALQHPVGINLHLAADILLEVVGVEGPKHDQPHDDELPLLTPPNRVLDGQRRYVHHPQTPRNFLHLSLHLIQLVLLQERRK